VGGVAMVVEGLGVSNADFKQALASLSQSGTPILGFIWNRLASSPLVWISPEAKYFRRGHSADNPARMAR